MKTIEIKLKKDVLIFDIPRLADYEFINKECKYLKVGNEEIKLNASTLDKFEFLCKGSELTEEIASELVDEIGDTLTKENVIENFNSISTFIHLIKSKGFYWLENPIEKPIELKNDNLIDKRIYNIGIEMWQEAEEKTFRNPLIFIKNE